MPEELKNYISVGENADEIELIINKSRFIGQAHRVKSKEEADEIINKIKKEHYKANHVCSAWLLATDPLTLKASDDGEPSGTAGRPILDVIQKKGLQNVLVTVVRYFGGIKLGSGGLIRAYSNSARDALDNAKLVKIEEAHIIDLEIEYNLYQPLKLELLKRNIFPVDENFTDLVTLRFHMPIGQYESFYKLIQDFTNDSFLIEIVETKPIEISLENPEYNL